MSKRATIVKKGGKYGTAGVKYAGEVYPVELSEPVRRALLLEVNILSSDLEKLRKQVRELCSRIDSGCPPDSINSAFMKPTKVYFMIAQWTDNF